VFLIFRVFVVFVLKIFSKLFLNTQQGNMTKITTENYMAEASKAIKNQVLQRALADLQNRFGRGTAESYRRLPEGPGLRLKAHDIRMQTIENLDVVLETLAANVRKNGGRVFFAEDGQAAVSYCLEVAQQHKVRQVVKGKSMVTEEIGLNPALEADGIEVVETDLGEYIIQLAGETPSHIVVPAVHKNRREIARLFADRFDDVPYTEDVDELTQIARRILRERFARADAGLSGVNFAVAETGTLVVVESPLPSATSCRQSWRA